MTVNNDAAGNLIAWLNSSICNKSTKNALSQKGRGKKFDLLKKILWLYLE